MRAFLLVWGRVPRLWRRWIVRLVAPSFTVGAACVIERDDGSILLVRLVYRNGWAAGWIDQAQGGRRELRPAQVKEEIGLDVELISEPAVVVDSRPQRIDVVFGAPGPRRRRRRCARPLGRAPRGRLVPGRRAARAAARGREALMALASSALGPVERGRRTTTARARPARTPRSVWRPLGPPASADPALPRPSRDRPPWRPNERREARVPRRGPGPSGSAGQRVDQAPVVRRAGWRSLVSALASI